MTYLRLALGTLRVFWRNKLRTFLAALGILIGIGAVSATISLGDSAQVAIASQIQGLGSNIIYVAPGLIDFSSGQGRQPGSSAASLSLDDARALADLQSQGLVTDISPELGQAALVERGDFSGIYNVVGAEPDFSIVHDVEVAAGRFIEQSDLSAKKSVVFLGANAFEDLFGTDVMQSDAIGKKIILRGDEFEVIGVAASSGGFGPVDNDNAVVLPLTVAEDLLNQEFLSSIYVTVTDDGQVNEVADQIGEILRREHGIDNPLDADFTVLTQDDILEVAGVITGFLTTAISAIAALSLLVGGVGILNTMLFTVVQRTREIGLRKSLGANKLQILWQFLVEAVVLSLFGGALGLLLTFVILSIADHFLDFDVSLSWSAVALSTVVSIGIGLIFGIAPARRAAKLSPIEALRHD